MADAPSVPEWRFDPDDFSTRDMHQLPSTPEQLPKDITFCTKVFVMHYDNVLADYRLCLHKDAGKRTIHFQILKSEDANVKACVIRTCHDTIGKAPDKICTALPTSHEMDGDVLSFAYVVLIEDLQSIKRNPEAREWLFQNQLDPILTTPRIEGNWQSNRRVAAECHRAFSALYAAVKRQTQT